jgi:hypothetical protein
LAGEPDLPRVSERRPPGDFNPAACFNRERAEGFLVTGEGAVGGAVGAVIGAAAGPLVVVTATGGAV